MQKFLSNLGIPIARKDGKGLGKLLEPDVEVNPALGTLIKEVGNCDVRLSFHAFRWLALSDLRAISW